MRTLLLVAVAVAGLGAGGLRPATATGGGAGDPVEVRIVRTDVPDAGFAFDPVEITVPVGATVRWVNDHNVFHTITTTASLARLVPDDRLRGRVFRAGNTVEFTFDEPGEYAYYCQPHADFMTAVIRVVDSGE